MTSEVWTPLPLLNHVYEAIVEVTRGGDRPAKLLDVMATVEKRAKTKVSYAELVKEIMRLEILGYVKFTSSHPIDEAIVELRR